MSAGRRRSRKPRFGELERYGVLALGAALVLGLAYLLQALTDRPPPFRTMMFEGSAAAAEASPTRGAPPAAIQAASNRVAALSSATEHASGIAAAGDERSSVAQARTRAPEGAPPAPRRDAFDFFEPPVRLPGKPEPAAPPPGGAPAEMRVVTVQKGDTLQRIAARELGDAGLWRVLLQWNDGLDPKRLKRGQELKIPAPERKRPSAPERGSARLHVVRPDDTLQGLALLYYGSRARWIDLLEANRDVLKDPGSLKAGTTIRIP